jgi:ParB-like chromosome segregation protein Spo0J
MSLPKMDYELVSVDDLQEHPNNPRRGDVEAVVTSIVRNGWHGVVLVQRSTGYVLAGNTRLRAARQLGLEKVPVEWKDCTDEEALNDLLSDNRAYDLGYFDEDALAGMLTEADPDALASMLFSADDIAGLVLPLDVPPEPLPDVENGEDDGQARITRSAQEASDSYLEAQTRSIVLPYTLPDYIAVTDHLRQLRQAYGLATSAEVIAKVVAEVAERVEAEA